MQTTRRLAAILAADIVGFSGLMEADEEGTFRRVRELLSDDVTPALAAYSGRLIKTMGDGFLAEFSRPSEALEAAFSIHRTLDQRESCKPVDQQMRFRMGVSLGDILVDEAGDVFGDGVNVAARMEQIATPGGVCVSSAMRDVVLGKLEVEFEDLGEQHLKNMVRPVRVFRARLGSKVTIPNPVLTIPEKPSIAVLPFDNMSRDADQEYVADGMVEAITAALSRIRSFFVVARNSAFTYKGRTVNVRDIGRELGVAYILEGSVQRAGNRLRIIVQLVETQGGSHVWSSRYDGNIDEIFELQDRITEEVAGALQPSIRLAEIERSRRKAPQDLRAYDYAMRAMPHVWAYDKEQSKEALRLLDFALELDPAYPLALSLAGWCHAHRSVYAWSDDVEESQRLATRLAERAAELSADDPLILAVLGAVHTFLRNYGTARVLLERAIVLDPNAAWAWSRLGWLDNYSDRPEQAIQKFERAMRLSPLDPMNFNNYVGIGSAHEVAENYEKAAAFYRRGLEERPNARWIYRNLASSLSGAGKMEEAGAAFTEAMRTYPDLTGRKLRQAMVFSPTFMNRMVNNLKNVGLSE